MNQSHICNCSAHFLNRQGLEAHLEENRSLQTYLSSRLEICRRHAEAYTDHPSTDDESPHGFRNAKHKGFLCPFEGCRRTKTFQTRQKLRRHFQQHVKCDEVCVCCRQVFKRVRDFVRDADRHKDIGETKRVYMHKMCNELSDRADEELAALENSLSLSGIKKRTFDMAGFPTPSERSQRPRCVDVEEIPENTTDFPVTYGSAARPTEQSMATTQSAASLVNLAEPQHVTDCFATLPTGPSLVKPVTDPMLYDTFLDARVNAIVNFPEW